MASSAHDAPTLYGATAAPPPTPSALPSSSHLSNSGAGADLLSSLLRRLPPNLSLPTRHRPPIAAAATTPLPTLSFTDEWSADFVANLSSASKVGFFQLTGHDITPELAHSAESDSLALFDLPIDRKNSYFPRNWPLGYEPGDEFGDEGGFTDSFCLDSECSAESTHSDSQPLSSLRDFTREMERVGFRVVEWLSRHVGFENPAREDPGQSCSFMWLSRDSGLGQGNEQSGSTSGGFYPFVVGLSYQIRCGQKYSLLADSGRVSVVPELGSVMVTIGDISQVWSNGKLKNVRGRAIPVPCINSDTNNINSTSKTTLTMSLLITLPLESTVSPLPLIPRTTSASTEHEEHDKEEKLVGEEEEEEENKTDYKKDVFGSFLFEDYAWRVYHERLSFKDHLDRYRV